MPVEAPVYPVPRAPMDLQMFGGDGTQNRPVLISTYLLLFFLQVPVLSQMCDGAACVMAV